jgi:hypothetical protein
MFELGLPWLSGSPLRSLFELLVLRTLPFAVYVCISGRARPSAKAIALIAWTALAAAWGLDARLLWLAVAMAYYAATCVGVHWLGLAFRQKMFSSGAVFAASAITFLLIPRMLLPESAGLSVLVVGWELTLASYSYCRDTRDLVSAPTLGECVFFLMVNPVLVFADRGSRIGPIRITWSATGRMALGLAGIVTSSFALRPTYQHLASQDNPAGVVGAVWALLGLGSLRFVAGYFAHSGVANLRIGLMRQLGHHVPDCFDYPFLASGPLDFWRRWNVYVMNWLKRYVYMPLNRSSSLRRAGPIGIAGAVFATFIASGLVHEMHAYAHNLRLTGRFTLQFVIFGGGLIAWLAVDRTLYWVARKLERKAARGVLVARQLTARVVIVAGMLGVPFVWG